MKMLNLIIQPSVGDASEEAIFGDSWRRGGGGAIVKKSKLCRIFQAKILTWLDYREILKTTAEIFLNLNKYYFQRS